MLQGRNCKIYKTNSHFDRDLLPVGFSWESFTSATYFTDNKNMLLLATADGWIAIEELQTEGKKRLDIKSFLAGNKI
jgi:methionyl-tRNA formyltransferase